MRSDMKLIIESWRRTTLLEGLADAIKNKQLDDEDVKEIGEKLSDKEGFQLAVQMFSTLSQVDSEEAGGLDEGPIDWINSAFVQATIAKDNLSDTLESDPRFAPILKLGAPALAMAFLVFKQKAGGSIEPNDLSMAYEIIAKKGQIGLEGLADAALMEKIGKLRSPNG